MLQEVLLQGVFVLGQDALGLMPRAAAAQARQTTLQVLVKVALDGAAGDIGVGGDVIVVQSVTLQPEDLHLAWDAGIRVVVPVVGEGTPVVRREGDRAHDGSARCCTQVALRR